MIGDRLTELHISYEAIDGSEYWVGPRLLNTIANKCKNLTTLSIRCVYKDVYMLR